MKTVAAWLAEYTQLLDAAEAEQSTPEESEANLRAFRQRLAAAPLDPVDKFEVLIEMQAAMIERVERWIHRQTFDDLQAQQNRLGDNLN